MQHDEHLTQPPLFTIDLGSISTDELNKIEVYDHLIVYLPLPSIGRTNSPIDICWDFIDASWVAENLSKHAQEVDYDEEYSKETYSTKIKLTLTGISSDILSALADGILIFQNDDEEHEKYQQLRDAIADYEEVLDEQNPRLPEIIDSYFSNLIGGAYFEYQSEAPDYYEAKIQKHPEHQIGFFKTAFSNRLGANSYVSLSSWLIPASIAPDTFFKTTGQRYCFSEFTVGEVFVLDGKSVISTTDELYWLPMSQYFKSRACASLVYREEDDWPVDPFDWRNAAFTFSPSYEYLRSSISESFRAGETAREICLVHPSGSLVLIMDGKYIHYLYDTNPLNQTEKKRIFELSAGITHKISESLGVAPSFQCDWSTLDDDQFECLCYDLILANPKFDSDTIRKMGKSRSRDGGRDIVVMENRPLRKSKKWIFQCKLIRNKSSLTGTKLPDVGDMLDQYGAQGFGVMTSAIIDATLYDKLDAICNKRGIEQMHFSVLEMDHRLARYPSIRKKYFPENL